MTQSYLKQPDTLKLAQQRDQGRVSTAKADAGLMHFVLRQQPGQPLIVQIDDWNAIAPRVPEIAAEWRDQFEAAFLRES